MKCAVCGKPGSDCYLTVLCETHVIEANRARDATFEGFAPWPEVVEFVAEWVKQERLKQPENESARAKANG